MRAGVRVVYGVKGCRVGRGCRAGRGGFEGLPQAESEAELYLVPWNLNSVYGTSSTFITTLQHSLQLVNIITTSCVA